MVILNQGSSDNCGTYAIMGILQYYWVPFDFELVSKIREPLIMKLQNRFIALWLVKRFITIPNVRLVDLWLKRWEHILTGTKLGDFSLYDNKWGVVEFDEWSEHYFIIVERCWDRYKCQNSWGAEWNWDGYFYINVADFRYLFAPRRVITNK